MSILQQSTNLLRKVMDYHNEGVVKRISKDTGCDYPEALEIFQDTKRFLYLCGAYGGGLAPSARVDDGWHAFILFTKDYMDFCMDYFGKYLHHYPNVDGFSKQKGVEQVKRTLKLANAVFGELSANWNYSQKGAVVMVNCGETCSLDAPCRDNPCSSCTGTTNCQG